MTAPGRTDVSTSKLPTSKSTQGEADGVFALFGKNEPVIEDPRAGRVTGGDGVRRFVAEAKPFWAAGAGPSFTSDDQERSSHGIGRNSELSEGGLAQQSTRASRRSRGIGRHRSGHHFVACLHELAFNRQHSIRSAFVPPEPGADHTDIVARYVEEGLMTGDVSATFNTHDPDMYFREPSGPRVCTGAAPRWVSFSKVCSLKERRVSE
jgi:hypothetical protein